MSELNDLFGDDSDNEGTIEATTAGDVVGNAEEETSATATADSQSATAGQDTESSDAAPATSTSDATAALSYDANVFDVDEDDDGVSGTQVANGGFDDDISNDPSASLDDVAAPVSTIDSDMRNLFGSDDDEDEQRSGTSKSPSPSPVDGADTTKDESDDGAYTGKAGKKRKKGKKSSRASSSSQPKLSAKERKLKDDEEAERERQLDRERERADRLEREREKERKRADDLLASRASGPRTTILLNPNNRPAFPPERPLSFLRLPNVVGFDNVAFDSATFIVQQRDKDAAGTANTNSSTSEKSAAPTAPALRASDVMVENVIRWRIVRDQEGNEYRESNARLVKWSDGSTQLLIGDERFDMSERPVDKSKNVMFGRFDAVNARTLYPAVNCGVGGIASSMQLVVTGIDSAVHQKLKEVVWETHTKAAKMKVSYESIDPEQRRKFDEEVQRKADSKRRREEARKAGPIVRMTADFLEGNDEEDDSARRPPRGRTIRRGPRANANSDRLNRMKVDDDDDDDRGYDEEEIDESMTDFIAPEDEEEEEEDEIEEGEVRPRRKHRHREREVDRVAAPVKRRDTSGSGRGAADAAAIDENAVIPVIDDTEEFVLKGGPKRRRVLDDDDEDNKGRPENDNTQT